MKIQLSLTALMLSSSLAMAGGDLVAPVEPEIEIPPVVVTQPMIQEDLAPEKSGVYIGLGYSCMQVAMDNPDEEFMGDEVSANVGYKFNENLAIEARYTTSIGDIQYSRWDADYGIKDSKLSNMGIYLKPQINLAGLGIYALLGYGQVDMEDGADSFSEDGFQYGVGTTFNISEVAMFVDYRRLYDADGFGELTKTQETAVNSFTLGLNYEF
jgi:opacity protein-like surface antigen